MANYRAVKLCEATDNSDNHGHKTSETLQNQCLRAPPYLTFLRITQHKHM